MRALDFLVILSLLTWILGLALEGWLSPEAATFALLTLVVLMGVARRLKLSFASFLLRLGLVLAALATLVIVQSGGTFEGGVAVLGALLLLAIVLVAVYVIVGGFRA